MNVIDKFTQNYDYSKRLTLLLCSNQEIASQCKCFINSEIQVFSFPERVFNSKELITFANETTDYIRQGNQFNFLIISDSEHLGKYLNVLIILGELKQRGFNLNSLAEQYKTPLQYQYNTKIT